MSNFKAIGSLSVYKAVSVPNTISPFISQSGTLTPGSTSDKIGYIGGNKNLPTVLKVLYSLNTGAATVVYEGLDGNIYYRENIPAGAEFWVLYYRIISSATIDGNVVSTSGNWGYGAGP